MHEVMAIVCGTRQLFGCALAGTGRCCTGRPVALLRVALPGLAIVLRYCIALLLLLLIVHIPNM